MVISWNMHGNGANDEDMVTMNVMQKMIMITMIFILLMSDSGCSGQ